MTKTNRLAKYYPTLAPVERLRLLMAAAARGDEAEQTRIAGAACAVNLRVADTFGPGAAFLAVYAHQRMELIELAGLYLTSLGVWEGASEEVAVRRLGTARVFGYLLNTQAEGLALFCEQLGFDPATCEGLLPGGKLLQMAADALNASCFTAEELVSHAAEVGRPAPKLKSAEAIADDLRDAYDAMLAMLT